MLTKLIVLIILQYSLPLNNIGIRGANKSKIHNQKSLYNLRWPSASKGSELVIENIVFNPWFTESTDAKPKDAEYQLYIY